MKTVFEGTLHHKAHKTDTPVTATLESGRMILSGAEGLQQEWLSTEIQSARLINDGSVILQNDLWFLDVREPGFSDALERAFGKRLFRRSFFDRIGVLGCLAAILLVLLPLLAVFFWLAPKLAEQAAKNVSPETERQIGDSWYRSLTAEYKIDTARTRLVQQFYDSLHFGGDYAIQITVVKEPVVNAFAVPGGHIVVFDSILGIMDAPEQLAGLLAHEASHIQLKHSTRAIFRELANQLLISLVFGDYGSISGIVAQHGGQLAGLSYSRNLELEADAQGLELLERSRIPLNGMSDLFRKMQDAAPAGQDVPNFLSTHPALDERVRIVEESIAGKGKNWRMPVSLDSIWVGIRPTALSRRTDNW